MQQTAPAALPIADQLAETVADAIVRAGVPGASRTDVQVVLQPEGLGRVHVGARLVDGRVRVEIRCDAETAATAVRATLGGLRDRLDAVTGDVVQLVVVHHSAPTEVTAVPSTPVSTTSTTSGDGRGSHSSPFRDPTPGGRDTSPSVRAEPAATQRPVARRGRGGDDLDLLI